MSAMSEENATLSAAYNDGVTATRRPVLLRLTAAGLEIVEAEAREPLALWAYGALRRLDEAFAGAPLRLTGGGDGRLTLEDGTLPPALLALAPQLAAGRPKAGRTALRCGLGFIGAVVALAIVLLALPHAARLAVPLVPKSWEQALGRQLSDEVAGLFATLFRIKPAYCRAPAGQAALTRLTARLGANAGSPFDFDVRVLDLPLVNAIALPGGIVFIFSGLLDQAESSDEIAGVLAHEMTHVARRHTTARLMETLGLSFIFGVMLGDLGSGALAAGGQAVTNLAYSRRAETEADDGAAAILAASNIDTQGLADFFVRLPANGSVKTDDAEESAMTYWSSHPASPARARRFAALAKPLPPALAPADWQALQQICAFTEAAGG